MEETQTKKLLINDEEPRLPKYAIQISFALQQGYKVMENGEIIGLRGKVLRSKRGGKQKYCSTSFSIWMDGQRINSSLPTHKVVACSLWGNKAFSPGLCVRHLDGNPDNNHPNNLALGTHSENNLDKDPIVRSNAAKKARATQKIPMNKIIDTNIILNILERRKQGTSYQNLGKEFSLARGTIRRICRENGK